LTANCTFIRPRTFNSKAIALVDRSISARTPALSEKDGMTQALSPL
jgi:hypothetical protein